MQWYTLIHTNDTINTYFPRLVLGKSEKFLDFIV